MQTLVVEIEEHGVRDTLVIEASTLKECRAMAWSIRDKEFPDGKIVSMKAE